MSNRWFRSDQLLLRAEVAGSVLVIGFEKWVFGLDLTPTADVPAENRA
jgi:hypothetical protein